MKKNMPTILIVDDVKENIDVLVEFLADDYDIVVSLNGKDALEILKKEEINLILLDIMMPEMDGFEVCKKICLDNGVKGIPIIFITARTDIESIEKAFEIGGSDYISKPFRPRELIARVKMHIKAQEMQKELTKMATTDMLTELYNRRHFYELSNFAIDLAKREKNPISILMIDIDKFKDINDTYGHDMGDKALKFLATKLKKLQRDSDIVSRYGGEEFVVLLPNTKESDAFKVAQKIREEVEKMVINFDKDKTLSFTVSIGISKIDPSETRALERGLERSDKNLYRAKESGRNCVV